MSTRLRARCPRPLRTVSDALRAVPVPLHRRLFPASVIGRAAGRGEDRNTDDPAADDRDSDDTAVARL